MAASRIEISDWFDEGKKACHDYMIVVCDSFDYEDYPVYADAADCLEKYKEYSAKSMQRVMEVYDLRLAKADQMKADRAWHLPER